MSAPFDGAALLEANRRRARRRRVLLAIALPIALVALILPVKIVSMYAFAHRAITAHVAGDHAGSTTAAHGQEPLNVFEPYKAPYNVGVGLAMSGDLPGARAQFESALALNPPPLESCAVYINLGITIERQGDAARAAGDEAAAEKHFADALGVVADTPEDCRSEEADEQSPDDQRSAGQSLGDLEDRLKDKQQPDPETEPSPQPSEDPDQADENQPSDEQLDRLEDQLNEGDGERQRYRDDGDGDDAGGAEKPW